MRDNGLVTTLAVLFVFFLWSFNRERLDRRFRLWVLGWSLVLVHFVSLLWQPGGSFAPLLRQAHIATLEVLAGICFILSEPVILRGRKRVVRAALLGVVPAVFTIWLLLFSPQDLWLACFAGILTNVSALRLISRHIGVSAKRGFLLFAVIIPSTGWLLGALLTHRPDFLLASIPAEIFLINAVLFGTHYSFKKPGTWVATSGFSLWAASSFLTIALRNGGLPDGVLPALLHFPEFIVAIGMTMIATEEDAASAREMSHEYETLFRTSPDALWIYDRRTLQILSVNAATAKLHGCTVEEMNKGKYTDFLRKDEIANAVADCKSGLPHTGKRWLHRKRDNSHFPMSVTSYDIRFQGRDARMGIGVDLTERELMFSQLVYQLEHDLLTGLPNRRKLLPRMDSMFQAAKRDSGFCAIIVLQIERFEKINEHYGYKAGDAALKEVARLLLHELRPLDVVGRTGGREFTIGLTSLANAEVADTIAANLQDLFSDPLSCDGLGVEISVSVGLAVYPEDADDVASLWRDATRAQARARKSGALHPHRLSRALSMQEEEENRVEAVIRKALVCGGFEVYYQPILDADRTVCGMEALLRLREPDGVMISPAAFIPVAESTGLIAPIGSWVLRQVCRQIRSWQIKGYGVVPIAVNVSALQIVMENFSTEVTVALHEFGTDPALLHLELTESSVMPHDLVASQNMTALARDGISFSIDDFGTGFSSLDRLHKLPVSVLKIDRAFVSRMLEPEGTLPIVATILSMAHALHMSVVAEGVETEQQYKMLLEMGCDQFQGFLFSKPVPADEAVQHLLEPGMGSLLCVANASRITHEHRMMLAS